MGARALKKLDFRFWGLVPVWVIMILTLMIPIVLILLVSVSVRGSYGGFEFGFTIQPYVNLFFQKGWTDELEFNPQYLIIVLRTLFLAGLTTVICMVISFPVAYFIAQKNAKQKMILIYLVTLPFWVSMIVRVYAWLIILSKDGIVSKFLTFLGLSDGTTGLLFSNTAMLIGMVYSYIPLMILPVFASVEKLDPAFIEASHDLYGSRIKTLRSVILPLCWPGLMAGAILVFIPCLGSVLEPTLLGGGKKMMLGNLITNQFGGARNWPFGAALSIVLLSLVLIVLMINAKRATRREAREGQIHV